jgi:NAD(P)H-nitrite reductase large subunit
MGPDDQICYCYHVPCRKLWHFARREKPVRASQMSECLGAGTGCGWCIPILKKIYESAHESSEPSDVIDMTPEEYAEHRQSYIREKKPRHSF